MTAGNLSSRCAAPLIAQPSGPRPAESSAAASEIGSEVSPALRMDIWGEPLPAQPPPASALAACPYEDPGSAHPATRVAAAAPPPASTLRIRESGCGSAALSASASAAGFISVGGDLLVAPPD